MASFDRRMIAPIMVGHFPTMTDTKDHQFSSEEWHGFLNAMTGLSIDLAEPNATAFDRWREALSEDKGVPVWSYTPAQKEAIRVRGEELKRKEEDRVKAIPEMLGFLRAAAPTKTAADLIKDAKSAMNGLWR